MIGGRRRVAVRRFILPLAILCVGAGALVASFPRVDEFPHEAHEGLFPVCVGCHLGVETGVAAELFPQRASCAACHDGVRVEPVEWSPPDSRASNLTFSHIRHAELLEGRGESVTCQSCHAVADAPVRMAVSEAGAEGCLACHAHEATDHLAEGRDCTACHVPLFEADRLPVERIATFPVPESHTAPDFVSAHAPETSLDQASCATCHTRDTCVRCHVNAGSVDAIVALEPDMRVALLEEGRDPEYPLPATHLSPDWSWGHGDFVSVDPASCGNCHTQPTCTTCHIEGRGAPGSAIATLPVPVPGGAPGVDLTGVERRVHPAGFEAEHAVFAASGALQCTSCHAQEYCTACHAGTFSEAPPSGDASPAGSISSDGISYTQLIHSGSDGGYHPANFLERHATEVFTARTDCQSCHSTEAFCRDCHAEMGLASSGRLNTAFHTAQPLWLLAHGQAARLNLESCAACHAQTDCLACHSGIQGRGVNPHGPGFDADRMASRNRVTCQWCHLNP